jgi:hypothetical protein
MGDFFILSFFKKREKILCPPFHTGGDTAMGSDGCKVVECLSCGVVFILDLLFDPSYLTVRHIQSPPTFVISRLLFAVYV